MLKLTPGPLALAMWMLGLHSGFNKIYQGQQEALSPVSKKLLPAGARRMVLLTGQKVGSRLLGKGFASPSSEGLLKSV